jgi:hypothetical protein
VVLKEKECCVPASQYIHPEFGFFCPAPRLRRRLKVTLACLAVAGLGATMMAAADRHGLDAVVARVDEASIVETVPPMGLAPFAGVGTGMTTAVQAPTAADKPPCVGNTQSVGNCVAVNLRKPRMVRVAIDRPAIAAIPIGRTASPPASNIDAALPAASTGGQGDPEKSGQAAPAPVAAASSTEPQKAAATPKKAQRSAHRQNQRRDQNLYGAPSWREVRVDDWGARGYAPRESDYQRGGYGRQGFVRNFW